MTTLIAPTNRFAQYMALTKPRVTQLAVFCAVIGMFLATPELPSWRIVVAATIGIWLLASAAVGIAAIILFYGMRFAPGLEEKALRPG